MPRSAKIAIAATAMNPSITPYPGRLPDSAANPRKLTTSVANKTVVEIATPNRSATNPATKSRDRLEPHPGDADRARKGHGGQDNVGGIRVDRVRGPVGAISCHYNDDNQPYNRHLENGEDVVPTYLDDAADDSGFVARHILDDEPREMTPSAIVTHDN